MYLAVLQLEFDKGKVLVACKGTLRREGPRRGWVWEEGFGGPPQEIFEKKRP